VLGSGTDAGIILEEEFRRQIRRTGWRIFTFGVPVLLLIATFVVPLIVDAVKDNDRPGGVIGYVDHSGITDSIGELTRVRRFIDVNAGTKSLTDGNIKALFVISADYIASGRVDWYRTGSGLATEDSAGDEFTGVLRIAVADESLSPEQVNRIVVPADYKLFTVDDEGQPEPVGSTADEIARVILPFIFAMLLLISVFVGSGSLLQSVTEEKENRMVEMLVTSTSPMSIMLGKVLGLGLAGLLQIGIWLAAAFITIPRISDQFEGLTSLSLDLDLVALMIGFYFAGYFLVAALMASIGAASTSVREASQISALVTLPAAVPVWFSGLIITNPDGGLPRVLTFFPLTSPTASMMRQAGGTNQPHEIWLGLLITTISAGVLLWLSARVFRAGLLLYGQRMSIRSVWKALRQAE
jgi:ABC-2 type transport system permease protein